MKKCLAVLLIGSATIGLNGCASPHTQLIEHQHWELNDAIRETYIEQLLLNIVPLRYDETPLFAQVSSISTSFFSSTSIGASGQFPSGGANLLGLNGSLPYTETPTVTWSLPDSREYLAASWHPWGRTNSRSWRGQAVRTARAVKPAPERGIQPEEANAWRRLRPKASHQPFVIER